MRRRRKGGFLPTLHHWQGKGPLSSGVVSTGSGVFMAAHRKICGRKRAFFNGDFLGNVAVLRRPAAKANVGRWEFLYTYIALGCVIWGV